LDLIFVFLAKHTPNFGLDQMDGSHFLETNQIHLQHKLYLQEHLVPKNCIMGPWQDWHPGVGGQIRYQTTGVAPCRKLTSILDKYANV
jgi:hypothetical protein